MPSSLFAVLRSNRTETGLGGLCRLGALPGQALAKRFWLRKQIFCFDQTRPIWSSRTELWRYFAVLPGSLDRLVVATKIVLWTTTQRGPHKLALHCVRRLPFRPISSARLLSWGPSLEIESPFDRFRGDLLVLLAFEPIQKCFHIRAQRRTGALIWEHLSQKFYLQVMS